MSARVLTYNAAKPLGFPSQQNLTRFYPTASVGVISNVEVVRFNIRLPNGYWDPYSAYMNIEVNCEDMEDNSVLQMDGSAHSLISSMVLHINSTEVERIMEYDVVAGILADMQLNSDARYSHSYQGVGISNERHRKDWIPPTEYDCIQSNIESDRFTPGPAGKFANTNVQDKFNDVTKTTLQAKDVGVSVPVVSGVNNFFKRHKFKPFVDYRERQVVPPRDDDETAIRLAWTGCHKNVLESQYQDYIDSVITYSNQGVEIADQSLTGVLQPYTYSFSNSSFEENFSKSYPNWTITGGLPKPTIQVRSTFSIPLLSGVLGSLMPAESYRWIPIGELGEVVLELRLSPYALFTSGYTDLYGVDASKKQQSRKYKITKFELVAEVSEFNPEITSVIKSNIANGMVLHTASWWNILNYNISNNVVPASVSLNVGFESLKSLIFGFYSNDYQNYSFCRKLYRLSHNITSMQLRVGTQFIPSQPIKGHGGNVVPSLNNTNSLTAVLDNSEYLLHLNRAFGKFLDMRSTPYVGTTNFAINDRLYKIDASERTWPRYIESLGPTNNTKSFSVPFGPFYTSSRINIGVQLDVNTVLNNIRSCSYTYDVTKGCVYGPYCSSLDLYYWIEEVPRLRNMGLQVLPLRPNDIKQFVCLFGPFFSSFDISGEYTTVNSIPAGQVEATSLVIIYGHNKYMDYTNFGVQGYYQNTSRSSIKNASDPVMTTPTIANEGLQILNNITQNMNSQNGSITAPYTLSTTISPYESVIPPVSSTAFINPNFYAQLYGPFITSDENLNVISCTKVDKTKIQDLGNATWTKAFRTTNPSNVTPNISCALGYPLFHENRMIGKALYGIDLETLDREPSVISGLNTLTARPFDLMLEYDPSLGNYKRQSTMQIFGYYDLMIRFSSAGIEVMGRS